jgi:hypothetical protein
MGKRGRRGREESSVAFHLLIDIAVAIDVASLVLPSLTFQRASTRSPSCLRRLVCNVTVPSRKQRHCG